MRGHIFRLALLCAALSVPIAALVYVVRFQSETNSIGWAQSDISAVDAPFPVSASAVAIVGTSLVSFFDCTIGCKLARQMSLGQYADAVCAHFGALDGHCVEANNASFVGGEADGLLIAAVVLGTIFAVSVLTEVVTFGAWPRRESDPHVVLVPMLLRVVVGFALGALGTSIHILWRSTVDWDALGRYRLGQKWDQYLAVTLLCFADFLISALRL